ncbi:DUF1302 domain-containing protein [Pseudomonas sp. G11-1]|uniref:DUF1302 domain-containing protein n=1 Tax=Halopseudomonas bauzanensis TaxID=653930 RepID=A0A4U0YKD3_9GAMM|nr:MULTISPECIES: DUF1302 domain-containing protein [Halopseudomonas]MCO5786164.1 DUF1302 domain-containing protein [Pseudomonas sp. G11-1]MCO5789390.1 DUF1302 domain-containing protein [Pseudomonas sp. G11-2]EZQ17243.1 hypothetical protein CF98_36305 [Halopseudomonas bauzanensis]TKA90174.1 DUF1302 domain-containing protein [Halopseudomonas bauzanensis]WGK62904.1 DUF1302 domain-containing protein [Halopseudomonas sp. SMJS2]
MTKTKHAWALAALPLAIGLASVTGSANAVTFNIGEVEAQFDSQLSIGASMSMSDPDKRFIHTLTEINGVNQGGEAAARTSDDGRLNYEKGDVFSKIFKGSHDLELRYGNSGAFIRGNYWYDFETKDGSQDFYDIDDSGRHPLQKGAGIQLLDAFVYHNYAIGNNPGNVRLGRQVVSWGEGVFIQNGINSINPIDASAFRRPGAELKEGLLPVEMLYLSQGLTENLTMEAFYQLKWHGTIADNCGTFFAGSDVVGRGCNDRLVFAGLDLPQGTQPPGTFIARSQKDRDASDSGQFGVAFRWFVPELNNTEFGFYAMNYHSRAPIYSNIAGTAAVGGPPTIGYDGSVGAAGYFFEHPEDIRLYGVSFGTDVGGVSVAGELSYRPNMPLQISSGDLSRTALLAAAGVPDNTHRGLEGELAPGDYIQGYERKGFWQASMSAVHFVDRVLGASRLALIGEVGANHISSIGNGNGETKFGRDSLFGQSPYADGTCSSNSGAAGESPHAASWCENDGFFTDFSWGYRLRASLDYSNVIAGINLTPNIAWSHDVEGYSPNFVENAKSISVGVNADYANKYNASLSYTNFFDGKYNTLVDRDFAAVSFGVSF